MNLDNDKNKKNPSQEEIDIILKFFTSKKLIEAKKEVDNQIIKYPSSFILFNFLGAILSEQEQLNEAVKNYKKSIGINPNYAQGHNNLGVALHKLDRIDEAIEAYKKAISVKAEFAEAFNNLGNAMFEIKKPREAIPYFEKAIKIKPDFSTAYLNLGRSYQNLGKKNKALEYFQEAIKIQPNYAEVYNHMGLVFFDLRKLDEALINYRKAIKLKPHYEKTYNNLANLLNHQGKYDEANDVFHEAIKIKPNYPVAYSNLIFNLNYKTNFDYEEYLSETKNFRSNCYTIKKKLPFTYQYEKKPKRLRLGLISADFGNHPGGFFTLSTLKELSKKNFDLIAYSNADRNDAFSPYFKPLFSKWNLIEKQKDEKVVEQIYKDGIHILMDLQGHSAKNRLTIFFHKAAPIQVTWLGQGTTGIPEIDYFIGSKHITPKNEENHYVEKVIRLPEISQCFTPPNFDIKIENLPALKNNFITFGSVNKLSKINDKVIFLWSKVLLSVLNSKLILKNKDFDDKGSVLKTLKRFKKHNISEDRLVLRGESKTREDLLKIYNEIDIALDTFPFQGNTTSCESVWMGVPVLTLKGDRYLFHFGESINSNLNMSDWIANSHEEYVIKAKKFSGDYNYLSKIRMKLREKALKSPVFDAERFSNHFSELLWRIWKDYDGKN